MRHLFILALICIAAAQASAADDLSKYEHWITGEVFEQHSKLMFRCDKPIKGNPAGEVVYLGSSKATMHVMLPFLSKAAERHQKLRLYGVLLPVDEQNRKAPKTPSAQFIVWKAHLPNEPDELPADQKIITGPNDRVEGYKVEEVKEAVNRSSQAMQRTASKATIDVSGVCHPRFGWVVRFRGLAVADLVSRP